MALQGDVQTIPLRELLGWLADRRASGTLSLSRGMIARRFHLRRGRVMLSSSTEEEMLLGRLLVARGLINAAQLQAALDGRGGTRPRLGTALASARLVSTAELRGVLTDKVRRLLVDALTWTEGGFFFDDGPLPKRPEVSAVVGLAEVLALPPNLYAPTDHDEVVVTDDDIVEIIELTKPRRPAPRGRLGRAKRGATTREGARRRQSSGPPDPGAPSA
jgi:hypothetical protein